MSQEFDDLTPIPAERTRAAVKISLSGIAGSGKSMTALLLAYGLCGDWGKIGVIDSEGSSAHLYANLPSEYGCPDEHFIVIGLNNKCSPERYSYALKKFEEMGMEVVIIDSITHEWHYLLDAVDKAGGSGAHGSNWTKPSLQHKDFLGNIVNSKCNVISTTRKKADYVETTNEKGKTIKKKVGVKDDQKEGIDYEVTIAFTVAERMLEVEKDRTRLFQNGVATPEPFVGTIETGKLIKAWINQAQSVDDVIGKIRICDSAEELFVLYEGNLVFQRDAKFIDAIKKRAIDCLDFYESADEIYKNWLALPMIKEDEAYQKAIYRRAIEIVHSMDTIDNLKNFYLVLCGHSNEPAPMEFMRTKVFTDSVTVAKELIAKREKEVIDPFDNSIVEPKAEIQSAQAPAKKSAPAKAEEPPLGSMQRPLKKAPKGSKK